MTTNEETKLNNNSPSVEEPHSDLPAAPPLYIKLDWGQFENIDDMKYVIDGDKRYGGSRYWDVRYTVYYIGSKDSKTIKYIHITTQVYDRVDEPLGETHETKITGPLEPQDYGVYDYEKFLSQPEYSTLGFIKVVKVIIT